MSSGCSRAANSIHVPGIRKAVATEPPWVERGQLGRKLWAIERSFYESRQYTPAWVDGDATTPQMKDPYGIDPAQARVRRVALR